MAVEDRAKAKAERERVREERKIEREANAKIREEKKKVKEHIKLLNTITPNKKAKEVAVNYLMESKKGGKVPEFPLKGCCMFCDNREVLYTYKNKRSSLEKFISKPGITNPYQ